MGQSSHHSTGMNGFWTIVPALVVLSLIAFPGVGVSQDSADDPVTFAADIAPLLQENCQVCHREGGIGPMSFLSYDEVRPWAPIIRDVVRAREMPPYHYDTNIGIQELKEDRRLTEEEIATFVAWADAGAPLGDLSELPEPMEWPDPTDWRLAEQFGQPDLVVPAKPFSVPAEGQDLWWEPLVEIPLENDRYIRAIEVKPSVEGRKVVHHANTTLYLPEQGGGLESQGGRFTEYASGKLGEILPEGTGRLLPANSLVRWSIHYYPMGDAVEDEVTELGFWLYPEGYEPELEQTLGRFSMEGDLDIAPQGTAMVQGFHSWDHPVRIDSFQPHGHLRLTAASLEVFYPDTGEREVVSMVSNWHPGWQLSHIYEDDVAPLIPVGAVMVVSQWYDNTSENPHNPDPDVWVYRGGRTTDEMSHAWIAVTHLDQQDYDRLVAERAAKASLAGDDG